jgi:hypothetical protein
MLKCFGPDASAVMYGRLTSVCWLEDSSILAFPQALHGQRVLADVDAAFLLELACDVVDDLAVEVLAAEEGVAVGREDLELALGVNFRDLDDRDVKGAAAEVVDRNLAIGALLVEAVSQRGRRGLVDDALDVEARDPACVLGRLALGVVEVGRHRDDRVRHGLTEVVLGRLLHLHEDARRDLGRRRLLALHLEPGVAVVGLDDLVRGERDVLLHDLVVETTANQPLDCVKGVLRVGDRLALGRLAHQDLVVLGERDDRRRRAIALAVLQDLPGAALHDGDARVGRAQVDTDDLAHADGSIFSQECVLPGTWGRPGPVSSVRGLCDDDPRWPQQPAIEGIALLGHRHDRVRGLLGGRLHSHGFVLRRVESLPGGVDFGDSSRFQGLEQQLQGAFLPFREGGGVGPVGVRQPQLETVQDRQQTARQPLRAKLPGVLDLSRDPLTVVFEVGDGAQIGVATVLRPLLRLSDAFLEVEFGGLRTGVRPVGGVVVGFSHQVRLRSSRGRKHPTPLRRRRCQALYCHWAGGFRHPLQTGSGLYWPNSATGSVLGSHPFEFKADPNNLAVRSTIGMTRSYASRVGPITPSTPIDPLSRV